MPFLQLKVEERCSQVTWRPGRGGPWLTAGTKIEHGDLTVHLANGGGEVEVKVFKGGRPKPQCRQVLRRNGTYILGAEEIRKM